ncbi:hypothetical protein ASPVEDRAFT_35013 [Aspergillus versicolor CBS 583.65]|uniref:Pyrroline-5-carboxylate reductase dimerisation domain-containing protein n=1 Tax=Aspergillus versicolor CBS 583.65 TaxID=1036611 RepID=A0A1L9Q569_ASPVE|nr:uncharacterized protein ASPVEDRAFT_35013 [Aspergillus versicolor CBS 583.65]OJJ08886.1 hypothetical protein ASPVEDRAFT_35013 [Aspergillus versicolor CBS 583.65]
MNSILQTSRSDNDDKCVYNAIENRVVISMLPKRSAGEIQCNDVPVQKYRRDDYKPVCFIRAVPNSAVMVCQSMTVIDTEADTEGIPTRQFSSTTWLCEKVGKVKLVPLEQFDASVMLAGGSMTMMALPLKGVLDGAVALGLTKRDVLAFSAQMLKGMAELLEDGTSPAELSESMSNQWNYMTRKLSNLEKKGIRVAFAEAMTD